MNQVTITKKVVPIEATPASVPLLSQPSLQISALHKSGKPLAMQAMAIAASGGTHDSIQPKKKRKMLEEQVTIKNSSVQNVQNHSKDFKKWSGMRLESNLPAVQNGNNNSKTPKKFKREVGVNFSQLKFKDIGGMDRVLKELCDLLMHIKHPEVYRHIGLPPPRGFLLHGPPGCGKTLLARAIAGVCFN